MSGLRARLRAEAGVSVVEAVVVSALLVVVLGATLGAWAEFEDTSGDKIRQNEAQQEARRAIDQVQTELRNLASPTNELPRAVEKAEPHDFVFQSIGARRPDGSLNERNARRVRYCADHVGKRVWRQQQTWTTATAPQLPATTACPEAPVAGGWSAGSVVARDAVNGPDRPLFAYNRTALDEITEVGVRLWVDADPARRPYETELASGAFLRNQNRRPAASFTATVSGSDVVLNGSGSSDPEGRSLAYQWYDGGALVGEGIVYTYKPPTPGEHQMHLIVRDPAGLSHTAATQTVCVVGPETPCP